MIAGRNQPFPFFLKYTLMSMFPVLCSSLWLMDTSVTTGCRSLSLHSIVPGGFEVMSYTTLFTPFTSLMILRKSSQNVIGTFPSQRSYRHTFDASHRNHIVICPAVPMTPTVFTGKSTAKACHRSRRGRLFYLLQYDRVCLSENLSFPA